MSVGLYNQTHKHNIDDEWANFMLKFSGCSLETVEQPNAKNKRYLDGSLMPDDSLSHASLSHTSLSHASLSHASLSHASLSHASLSHAYPVMMDEIQTITRQEKDGGTKLNLGEAPTCSELHISTKTKVLYLNCPIDTVKTFWSVPIIDYWRPIEGVIKKQTKITSFSPEELEETQERLRNCGYHYTEMVIKSASTNKVMPDVESNPVSTQKNNRDNTVYQYRGSVAPLPQTPKRIKFKDDRKITIGIAKKDIMNCRGKPKKAFMNCFAIIIRFKYKEEFREVHVKVFNTGKLEIPGVPDDNMLRLVREKVIEYLQPYLDTKGIPLEYIKGSGDDGDEDVLINSGFHCGFCIDQKAFYAILRSDKYGIETSYDSCHYPGIRCKYYYRTDLQKDHPDQGRICLSDNGIKLSQLELSKKYTCVSFMIFSTGNCLVVGNCSKVVLLHVFEFIKRTLAVEYGAICLPNESVVTKLKKKKQRKKTVYMQMHYYSAANSGNV